jgi:HPt (histidine-containing phosphotransfer) domain-containing protein
MRAAEAADISAYTVTVHGLKSALANIGETELSATAGKLEQAGRDHDADLIKNKTREFSAALKTAVEKIKASLRAPAAQAGGGDDDLKTALAKLQEACGNYDKKAAKDALAPLKDKTWPADIQARLDAIDARLLHSDFDEIQKLIAQ